ncbi:MAG: 4Fe-4S binding protein [Deltaproteobacteria bacterium]|nr:4Fe-4S binding protein [Deltaproteobacteria bacterium]
MTDSQRKCHIIDACIACGSCETACPERAISEGDIFVVDNDLCNGCSRCARVCPVDACVMEDEVA